MLMNLQSIGKTIGTKRLYDGLNVIIQPGEKVGLIGRNGIGKTTLLHIMDGTDSEYSGTIDRRRGLIIASTAQEHHGVMHQPVLEYVLDNLPEYGALKHVIDHYPDTMGDDMTKITEYTDALSRFGELGYYDIEDRAKQELDAFGLTPAMYEGPMERLSGGQKRFVELTKVTLSDADLALIDEPTNHMDYVAKAAFVEWFRASTQAVVVITHDRDVLAEVDRIIEIKDHEAIAFKGNYRSYLKQNSVSTQSGVEQYETAMRTLDNLKKQIQSAKAKSAGAGDSKFRIMQERLQRQHDELAARTKKPTFWIDQESASEMKGKAVEKYDRYKARNIRMNVRGAAESSQRQLVGVDRLSLGYDFPLFSGMNFNVHIGERFELHGRNGAGKSTLVRAIQAAAFHHAPAATVFAGRIECDQKLRIGVYEQEIDERFLDMPLGQAIEDIHRRFDVPVNDQRVRQLLSDYLFDPSADSTLAIRHLSGGQKARFQLIAMLCHAPNLLILDEPTNHLDLPSIEELEKALVAYTGAIIFISHDSFFVKNLEGERLELNSVAAKQV